MAVARRGPGVVLALFVGVLVHVTLAAGRAAAPLFTGSFTCGGTGTCSGTIVDPAGGPTIEGFYLQAPGSNLTLLQVDGHAGQVGPNGPGGALEILFAPNAFIMPGSTATFSFTAAPSPASLAVVGTADQQTYLAPVTFPAATQTTTTTTQPTSTGPERAPLPPKAGTPIRVTLPLPPGGQVGADLLSVPLTSEEQTTDGKPDVGVRIVVEHGGSLPAGVSIQAAAAETTGKLTTSFVIPHVLEKSGQVTNNQFTFDTTLFATYVPGLGATGATEHGVTVDVYLFDTYTGQPLDSAGRSKQLIRMDDLITAHKPPGASVCKAGFGVIVVGGSDPDGVNFQGFVVNSHTGPFDLSVFGFEPQALRATQSAAAVRGAATQGAADLACGRPTAAAAALTSAVRPAHS